MADENAKVAAGAQGATKKIRRGISNSTQAVTQLKFHEKDAAKNGLFKAFLAEVRVDWSNNSDAKMFPGIAVPRLTFHFTSQHPSVSEQRHVYQTLFPVESNVNTIPGGNEEWKVNNVFAWIKHILDVFYLKGRELTEAEEDALSLPFADYDESGQYVNVEPEEVIAGYQCIFENASAMLNGSWGTEDGDTPKPCFKTTDGKLISCWIKLLRHKKRKGDWINVTSNGDLGFDNFIGSGVVELAKKDLPPTILNIDLAKESITPKDTNKTPTIGAPGMGVAGMGGVVPGMPSMGGTGDNGAYAAAGVDMPF